MKQFAVLAALIAATGATPVVAKVPKGYHLVWSDEFNKPGLPDPGKWMWDTHANKRGWYNEELQYYAANRAENARIEDGKLVITARREALTDAADYGGQQYTSARLTTQGKARWTYGFFEIRARLPCGAGTWPAIWTLGDGRPHPDGGEIDIMEQTGNDPSNVSATIHNRATVGTYGNGAAITLADVCEVFHDYQLTWNPDALAVTIDGKPVHRYARQGKTAAGWPFDQPQYLLLNLAIGGAMGGKVDDAIFPRRFEIDYVRVYQHN